MRRVERDYDEFGEMRYMFLVDWLVIAVIAFLVVLVAVAVKFWL